MNGSPRVMAAGLATEWQSQWNEDAEQRAASRIVRVDDVDATPVQLDDAARHRQAEAGAACLRGVERLEDARAFRGRDAGTVIAHGELQAVALRGRGDAHLAAGRRHLKAVVDEVDQHLLDARGVQLGGVRRAGGVDLDALGIGRARRAPQELAGVRQADADRARARELEQIGGELLQAHRLLDHAVDAGGELRLGHLLGQ